MMHWKASLLLLFTAAVLATPAARVAAQDADLGFSPASGHARVIAQGVVPLPTGEAVWRTVRTRAPLPADAAFEDRPLGFVLATAGPLLLVDQESAEQMQLGVGEAALVRGGGTLLASLADQPVSYLSIELVATDAAPPPASATVLQPGQPFPAPTGFHDLDLLSDTLAAGEVLTVPASGAKNVILITDGAAAVGRPGSDPVVLLAGEAATFSGELEVGAAPDGAAETPAVSFVVAMIGPELPQRAVAEATPSVAEEASEGSGSIAVEVFTCPAGMTPETLNAAACAPATGVFDVTISGAELPAPLTLGDATASGTAYAWDDLPFGAYVVAEAVPPSGYGSYILSARETSGDPITGYRVTLDANTPDLAARIYNFKDATS